MCNPISLIMSADRVWLPQTDGWNHSHSMIAAANGIADGLMGDKYARVEVRPPQNIFRDNETNAVLAVDDSWSVVLDEARVPGWWQEDSPACAERARDAARRWLASFPPNLVPDHKQIGGYGSTLTGGYGSTLTGGDRSTLTGGCGSAMSCRWWDGARWRISTHYVGENGVLENTKYRAEKDKLVAVGVI